MPEKPRSRVKTWLHAAPRAIASAALVVLITLVLILVVEGAASVIVVFRGQTEGVLLERAHTEFDAELGWINQPNAVVPDLYGKGMYLQTNSQRFRSKRDFERQVPRGKIRAICTGDSFTLGYGVSNDDAWCELLGDKDTRFETVNMGQGGYGVDQAYLWYERDGLAMEHDVLIFAFVAWDFSRMMSTTFAGYPKPVLGVADGKPVITSRASRFGYVARGLGQRWKHLKDLRFAELWHSPKGSSPDQVTDERVMTTEEGRRLALAMFHELAAIHARRKTALVVVLLPVLEDYHASAADEWQGFLRKELAKRNIPFVDLVAAMRDEPAELVPHLFRGHYNERGNRWVADRLYEVLVTLPHVRERLEQVGPPARPVSALMPVDSRLELEKVSLYGARARASSLAELSTLVLDGSLSTRWNSGAPQSGHEEIVVDLGKPQRLRRVRLDLGEWGYDFGRRLALDVALDEAQYREAMRVDGDRATQGNLDGSGETQVLTLDESVEARYVRVRQLAQAEENFWSVAEISVFREKQQ